VPQSTQTATAEQQHPQPAPKLEEKKQQKGRAEAGCETSAVTVELRTEI